MNDDTGPHPEAPEGAPPRGPLWWRVIRARPTLMLCIALGAAVYALLPAASAQHAGTRTLVAWNAGAITYLLAVWRLARQGDAQGMRERAIRHDDGRLVVLVLVILSAAAVLLAVGSQLAAMKELHGAPRTLHIALAVLTVVTSWLFTQALFALHYAHDYYVARIRHDERPLDFPGTAEPDYGDFFYFAFVIGTSGQTADVAFNGSRLRAVGTVHCVLAFFFNATLLALTINIAAGLL